MPTLKLDIEEFIYSLKFPEDHKEIENRLNDFWNVLKGRTPISRDILDKFTKMFFESGSGIYIGIESHLPSEFLDLYPSWLKYHAEYLKKLPPDQAQQGGRILIARSIGEIFSDKRNPNFYKFVNWHKEKKVPLSHVSEEEAKQLCELNELPSPDVAIWKDSYAVVFKLEKSEMPSTRIFLFTKDQPEYTKITNYAEKIKSIATELNPDELGVISPELAMAWSGYTGSLKDRKHIHEFLDKLLKKFKHGRGTILDAAAGIGNEALYLLKKGYVVEINEVDPTFEHQLLKNFCSDVDLKERGITEDQIRSRVHRKDWRDLTQEMLPGTISAILVLGNSLSMVVRDGKEERKKCIEQFFKLLSPGGMLIIDERNYPKIRDELKKGKDVYGKGVLYPAPEIICKLTLGDNDKIILFNFMDKYGKKLGQPIPTSYLEKDELKNCMEEVFKSKVTKFSGFDHDLSIKLIKNPDPNADVYFNVVSKPASVPRRERKLKIIKKLHKIPAKATLPIFIGSDKETAQWGVIGKSEGKLVKLDLDAPHVIFVCGGPGSGKGYTIGVICEMLCTDSIPKLSQVSKKSTIIVFHYPREDQKSEFWSITEPNAKPEEVEKLRVEYGVDPKALVSKEDVRIFVDPLQYEKHAQKFKDDYNTNHIYPTLVCSLDLKAEDWGNILSAGGSPLYIKRIYSILEELRSNKRLDLDTLKTSMLSNSALTKVQQRLVELRLEFLKNYLIGVKDRDFTSKIAKGGVNIFDFREIIRDPEDIFTIMSLIISCLQGNEELKDQRFVFVINEAHNFFRKGITKKFVDNIVYMVKRKRHVGSWWLLDTQNPDEVDDRVIREADIKIVHGLYGTFLESKILRRLFGERVNELYTLGTGNAYVVAERTSEGRLKPIKVNIRARITKHGAPTKTLTNK
jgi:hypothetical protein